MFWDRTATLVEMRRARKELGLTGFTITDAPERIGLPDYGDASWNDFWETATEPATPLNFHIAAAGTELFSSAPWPSFGPECRMAVVGALLYLDNARMITNLLCSDVLERYPALRFVSVESGIGWIPFLLEACEYQWVQIEKIGAGNVLFETDFPHPTCLYPHAREHLRDVLGGLTDAVRRSVLHDNAARLYGIGETLPAVHSAVR